LLPLPLISAIFVSCHRARRKASGDRPNSPEGCS
jgi:hypothetical protein